MRDFNTEYQDVAQRQYAYDFDWVIRRYLLKAVSSHFKQTHKALELGCFQGDMTDQLLGYFDSLTVVEAASDLCAMVKNRFPAKLEVINATFAEAELPASFDTIFLVHTLEHLDDPVGALKKIQSWMSADARLIVAVPNANALSRQIAVKMGLVEYNAAVTSGERDHGHRITYSMDRFEHDLRSAGLKLIDGGGILVKTLANFQFDKALKAGIINEDYLNGCYELGRLYPDLCASLFWVCGKGD